MTSARIRFGSRRPCDQASKNSGPDILLVISEFAVCAAALSRDKTVSECIGGAR
jgi:hypothetical protein